MTPSEEERREHYELEHTQYRSWCGICVRARGLGQPHLAAPPPDPDGPPKICCDYCYMSGKDKKEADGAGVMPILAIKDSKSKGYGASTLKKKGAEAHAVAFVAGYIKELGYRRILTQTDGEPAIVSLMESVAASLPEVEFVPQNSPPYDHSANGEAEVAGRELKRHCRAIKFASEERSGKHLPKGHPLLSWIPRHAANVLSRYRRGDDGRTAEQRRTGRRWRKPVARFGEQIYFKPAALKSQSNYEEQMLPGRYIGHHTRTGAVLVMLSLIHI